MLINLLSNQEVQGTDTNEYFFGDLGTSPAMFGVTKTGILSQTMMFALTLPEHERSLTQTNPKFKETY